MKTVVLKAGQHTREPTRKDRGRVIDEKPYSITQSFLFYVLNILLVFIELLLKSRELFYLCWRSIFLCVQFDLGN